MWAGSYELQPGLTMVVSRDGDRLMSRVTGQGAVELHPASTTRYFVREVASEVEFVPGGDGRAAEIVLSQGGQQVRAPRVD